MNEEEKQIMNKMIYCNLVSGEQALKFNSHIKEILQENEQQIDQLQQKENIIKGLDNTIENLEEVVEHKENIIKEVRECINKFLCTEEYIKVDGKAIADNYKELLEILDKEEE